MADNENHTSMMEIEGEFMIAVWEALKADTNDLRKQQRILKAFRAALELTLEVCACEDGVRNALEKAAVLINRLANEQLEVAKKKYEQGADDWELPEWAWRKLLEGAEDIRALPTEKPHD